MNIELSRHAKNSSLLDVIDALSGYWPEMIGWMREFEACILRLSDDFAQPFDSFRFVDKSAADMAWEIQSYIFL